MLETSKLVIHTYFTKQLKRFLILYIPLLFQIIPSIGRKLVSTAWLGLCVKMSFCHFIFVFSDNMFITGCWWKPAFHSQHRLSMFKLPYLFFVWKNLCFPAEKQLDSWWNTLPDTMQRRFCRWCSSTWHYGAFDKWGQLPQTASGPGQDTAHGWGRRSGLYCPLSLTHAHCNALPAHWWVLPCVVCVGQ